MFRKPVLVVAVAVATVAAFAYSAYAATGVSNPAPLTFNVPGDANGVPQSVTVSASGFTPGSQVFIEQCDGVDPTSLQWNVVLDCDLGSSTSPAIADSTGTATFPANDPNLGFTAFKGDSPQDEFNCLSPKQLSPANGLPDFRNCKIRVSTNNTVPTGDQVFFNIVLPDAATPTAHCSLGTGLATVKTAAAGVGLTDQTQDVAIGSKLLKSGTTILGGTCTGLVDSHYAGAGLAAGGAAVTKGTLHETSVALKLTGAASCVFNGPGVTADGSSSNAYPLSGALQIQFSELGTGGATYKLAAEVAVRHDLASSDLYDFKGVVTKGLSVGATVSGTAYLDPVSKFGGTPISITSNAGPVPSPLPAVYTGYGVDTVSGNPAGCNDGIAGNTTSAAKVIPAVGRTDTATVTLGSSNIADAAITAADLHKPVSGTGIPTGSYVGTVTPGVGFTLSSSITSTVPVTATKAGTSVKVTNIAFNIKAQTGIVSYQIGDGVSPLGSTATGLTLSF